MIRWQDWAPHDRAYRSPYVDWEVGLLEKTGALDDMVMVPVPPPFAGAALSACDSAAAEVFPVPKAAANPQPSARLGTGGVTGATDPARLPMLNASHAGTTVVVGVIDTDIGFGHRRFRMRDGRTRVLASWQQGANWRSGARRDLPFGEELFEGDINAIMRAHAPDGPDGVLEHEGFYTRLGLISNTRVAGMGALAKSAAHGTHVLGLAAGQDPRDDPEGFADNVRLLVVNLPHATAFGEGGAFLDYYLSYGLQWIRATHAAIVAANSAAGLLETPPPLFINISFGKQAGAPDPWLGPEDAPGTGGRVGALAHVGATDALGEVLLVPAGNDNVERCHALFAVGDAETALDWRVQPDDETSNFLDIWALPEFRPGADGGLPDVALPFEIDLELPDGTRCGYGTPAHGAVRALEGGLGRIYCDWVYNPDRDAYRLRYLVCLAPDGLFLTHDAPCRGAPAGRYRLHLRNTSHRKTIEVRARVQTDEATLPSARNARRAYFEDPDYARFEPDGRLADSYPYPGGLRPETFDTDSPVRRHGTMNAYATSAGVVAVAGFRQTDGRPAVYSATGLGVGDGRWGRAAPTAAFPSDDGAAHFGLLSDGARDGSVMALQGTSFACASATRFVTEAALSALLQGREPSLPRELTESAAGAGWTSPHVAQAKAGLGRVPFTPQRKVDRL